MSVPRHQRTVFLLGPERVELRTVPVPEPGPGELLLKIEAATTCGTDVKVLRRGGHPRMLQVPTPFGHEMAGTRGGGGPEPTPLEGGRPGRGRQLGPCGACEWCLRDRENLCADLQYLNGAFAEYLLVPRRFAEVSTYRDPRGARRGGGGPGRAARLRAARPGGLRARTGRPRS